MAPSPSHRRPPLLTFPPSRSPPNTITFPLPASPFNRLLSLTPLIFIALILLFSFYAFSTLLVHLFAAGEWVRTGVYTGVFGWLWSGTVGGVGMAWWVGGGRVGGGVGGEVVEGRTEEGREEEGLLAQEELEEGKERVQVKSGGGGRFCRKCQLDKPDRAHHCSSCGYCVLKMDHHCPWLGGGCVGFANYKFFLLFLWYGGALGTFVFSVTLYELTRFVAAGPDNFELAPISWALVMLLGGIFGFAMSCFGAYHLYLACRNRFVLPSPYPLPTLLALTALPHSRVRRTTIEAMERAPSFKDATSSRPDSALTRLERRKLERLARANNIYDLGPRRNLATIFGGWEKRWIWAVPIGSPEGDGREFEIDWEALGRLREETARIRGGVERGEERVESEESGEEEWHR